MVYYSDGQIVGALPSAGAAPTYGNERGPRLPRLPKPGVYPYGNGTNVPGALNGPTSLVGKYFPGLTGTQQSFYQSKEGNPYAYQHMIGQMAKPGTFGREWLADQYSQVLADYVNASSADPALQLTDYLEKQAPKLAERYTGLRGWERGEGAASFGPGRQVYR